VQDVVCSLRAWDVLTLVGVPGTINLVVKMTCVVLLLLVVLVPTLKIVAGVQVSNASYVIHRLKDYLVPVRMVVSGRTIIVTMIHAVT
jgi:hypothetical protein